MFSLNTLGRWQLLIAVLTLLGAIFLYYETYSFPPSVIIGAPGPATLPRMALGGIFLALPFAFYEIFKKHRRKISDEDIKVGVPAIIVISVLVSFFALLLNRLGFEITSYIFLFGALLLTTRKLATAALLAVAGVLICYAIFVVGLKLQVEMSFLPARPFLAWGY